MKRVIYKCVTNNIYLGNGDSVRRYFISLYRLRALASRIGDRGTCHRGQGTGEWFHLLRGPPKAVSEGPRAVQLYRHQHHPQHAPPSGGNEPAAAR